MSDQINFELPSPETLAGIYICVEGEEDLTVRPKQIQPIHIEAQPANGGPKGSSRTTLETEPGD